MTDPLRTRIAKAIAGAVYGHNTHETAWADLHEDAQDEYFAEADAVIRELPELRELRDKNQVRIVTDVITRTPDGQISMGIIDDER